MTGDVIPIYRPPALEVRAPARHLYSPSELAPKILCLGFQRKKWTQEPPSKRKEWSISHRINATKTIIAFERRGQRYLAREEPSGSFGGRPDLLFEDGLGQRTNAEVEGSAHLKDHKIIQGILYHESSDSIAIASREEILEPEAWLIEAVKAVAVDLSEFLQEFPDRAREIFTPHRELCPMCSNEKCTKPYSLS